MSDFAPNSSSLPRCFDQGCSFNTNRMEQMIANITWYRRHYVMTRQVYSLNQDSEIKFVGSKVLSQGPDTFS